MSDFSGADLANNLPVSGTSEISPQITSSGWQIGEGLTPVDDLDDRLGFIIASTAELSTLENAKADSEYLTITLTPTDQAQPIDLGGQRLSFSVSRISYYGARSFSVLTSLDGFTNAVFTSEELANGDYTERTFSFIFPLTGYDNLTEPLEIRIYPHNVRYNQHQASLTGFSITDPGPVHALALTANQGGAIHANPGSTLFATGEGVSLTVSPEPGYRFLEWRGSVTSRQNPLSISLQEDMNVEAVFVENAPNRMAVGMNLAPVNYWASAVSFTDLMKYAGSWASQPNGATSLPPLGARGYPTHMPYTDTEGNEFTVRAGLPHFVAGAHTLSFEGTGIIRLNGGAVVDRTLIYTGTGGVSTFTVMLNAPPENLLLMVLQSSASDPVRNIQFHLPGFDDSTTFHPDFLQKMQSFACLRMMDWGQTNSNPITTWADRTTVDYFSQGRRATDSVAMEYMVQLGNTLRKPIWICIPHAADDNYITQTATLIRDSLAADLQVYVEYSNETWNGAPSFQQTYYTREQGTLLGLSENAVEAGNFFHTMRSARAWQIFQDVFAGHDPGRVVNVMASWAANSELSAVRLQALANPALNPTGIHADALAIAPYFGHGISGEEVEASGYPSIDDIVTTRSIAEIEDSRQNTREHKEIADQHGTRLICYEGGQHWTNSSELRNDETLTDILTNANRDPRMGTRYTEYLNMLQEEGIDLFANFLGTQAYSRFGSWGIWEYHNQPLSEAPKAAAIFEWMAANPVSSVPSVTVQGNTAQLSFPLFSGKRYTLESSTDLSQWISDPTATRLWGNHTMIRRSFVIPENEQKRFWRLVEE
ncbi:MAG: InlB B-repeat-containing protein [Akkermansiaceae bacterium]